MVPISIANLERWLAQQTLSGDSSPMPILFEVFGMLPSVLLTVTHINSYMHAACAAIDTRSRMAFASGIDSRT
jgi:hypothetical protein